MLQFDCNEFEVKCQGYHVKSYIETPEQDKSVIIIENEELHRECPDCGTCGYINDKAQMTLKDMPLKAGCHLEICCLYHQYQCPKCGKTYKEQLPFQYPGTRITKRAAGWIRELLKQRMSVRAIQKITGIHWDTIHKVQKELVDAALLEREQKWKAENYKPRLLAVDEFAIHKGHKYATCVLDLETGEALWVGNGRSIADFTRFFEETPVGFLGNVEAVAMDMNASYNKVVQQYLPNARIVYDRFHMQAQYGKEVLGVVRLAQAREHKANAVQLQKTLSSDFSDAEIQQTKQLIQQEKDSYRKLKRARWSLLRKREHMPETSVANLEAILTDHADLAVCYAMKEELNHLFSLRDEESARVGWNKWFSAAVESNIPALVHFANLKRSRLEGLVAHAQFPISTGKLEGFNNKVKLIKRIAFGYRDKEFFFSLVKFFSSKH